MLKKILSLVLLAGVVGLLLFLAWHNGRSKFIQTMVPYDKFVPVPMIFEQYKATAVWLDREGGELDISWRPARGPLWQEGRYFTCLGTIKTETHSYYVLEYQGRLFLESGDLIEPLIHALCALSRGGGEHDHPARVEDSVACLPDDPLILEGLVTYFKPQVRP